LTPFCRWEEMSRGALLFLSFWIPILANATSLDETRSVKLIATGDVIPHLNVLRSARENGTAENFHLGALIDESVLSRLRAADLAFANLETPLAAQEYNARKPFVFNAPKDFAHALAWMGFDVLSVANNHSYDQSRKGVTDTLRALQSTQIKAVGAGLSRAQALEGVLIETQGLRIGWIAFSAFFNSEPRRDQPKRAWVARLKDRKLALRAVRELRKRSDILVVSVHWGQEYQSTPERRQKKWAQAFADAGADLILGHHPHVLQPLKWIQSSRGTKTLVAYSLGNFLSNQQARYRLGQKPLSSGDPRDGVLLEVELTREGVRGFNALPLWTHHARGNTIKIVVKDVRQEIARLESRQRRKPSSSSSRNFIEHYKQRLKRVEAILKTSQVLTPNSR
jgi:hypothetical protein